ncbi:MAG: hypothetical protein F8N36_14330 [Desulfovibrio sp.]|uniref:hypothetical protein n=1 Tax=Desulfovibrio sp. TaxID=885 RepID=UPI00135D2B7C|nr:hypothetical protein [Desulfovibrio sp.]MTJ94015.1 hypothetical protein [Desulfovibrio sp.]
MSKVYFPIRYIDVPASDPHRGDPAYRVSYGVEHWADGSAQHVYKVQMVYGGIVAGRKSPSFPANSDDLERVIAALTQVKSGHGKSGRGQMSALSSLVEES